MKLSRLFRLGKQGYDIYRSYKGGGRSGYGGSYRGGSYGGGYGGGYGGSQRRGGTLERLLRRFLK